MASLMDGAKAACDRLAPLGWRDLLLAVTDGGLDIAQGTAAALASELQKPLPRINRTIPGFEDFNAAGTRGIAAGQLSESLLYHAFASPRVVRGKEGALLGGFPTVQEIEVIENLVFGIAPRTLATVVAASGAATLAVVVFATEYRPVPDCADGPHADLAFSRTGIARVGTARPKYLGEVRGCWPEDEDNPNAFRIIPVRLTAWLAAPVGGDKARVMRVGKAAQADSQRTFWIPVHKLFDGPECLQGLDLHLKCSASFFNMKLQRVMKSLADLSGTPTPIPSGAPYVLTDGLATLEEHSELWRIAVVPVVHQSLVQPAQVGGKPLTYRVPPNRARNFATYTTDFRQMPINGRNVEIHAYPAYVHARTKVDGDDFIDLNDEADVNGAVDQGGYDALLYVDTTGEGWVSVEVPALAGAQGVAAAPRPAYVLLGAPDFFPSCGQRELSRWTDSEGIPKPFRNGQIWAVQPEALNETRLPANLQLPGSPFDPNESTMTAVVGMGSAGTIPPSTRALDVVRASTLPDDGAGVFSPGWDAAVDVKSGMPHLAAYGLGSPFPEDAKLCAALSTFWPAVSPDVYRTMSMHTGNSNLRGTVAPLTDEEIGQIGTLPWDGVAGPRVVSLGGQDHVEMASFLHVDYVQNAVENRFSTRLTARITSEEYQRRIVAAARIHWVLSGGHDVRETRKQWLLLSFRTVAPGDPDLQNAQLQAGHILRGNVYRAEACHIGKTDRSRPKPGDHRFRHLPIDRRHFLFVSPQDPRALLRRKTDPKFASVNAE